MKKVLLAASAQLSFIVCFAQFPFKVNDLNIPTSPAFVLMDKSPASIEKPSNPRALAVSLVNVWQNSGALEFAPYWLKDRPAYTFDDNINNVSPVFQTFGISAATTKVDSVTNLAVGFRTQFLRYYSKAKKNDIDSVKSLIIDLLSQEDPDDIDLARVDVERKALNDLQAKKTFNAELAAAYMGQTTKLKGLESNKAGAWLNIRWTPNRFPLDFVFLTRYSWAIGDDSKSGVDSAFFDYGLNLSYQDKDKNFDLQVEYVNRRDFSIKSNYDRFALIANYQIIPGIVAVVSVGKDFKKVSNVFTLLGLKFGISKEVAILQ
jgi:hypothetical protein